MNPVLREVAGQRPLAGPVTGMIAAALEGCGEALRARLDLAAVEGRMAARCATRAVLMLAVGVLAAMTAWTALQAALLLALLNSGVLTPGIAAVLLAVANALMAYALIDAGLRWWREVRLPVTRRLLREALETRHEPH